MLRVSPGLWIGAHELFAVFKNRSTCFLTSAVSGASVAFSVRITALDCANVDNKATGTEFVE
jgi:hypothetical protein